MKEPLIPNVLEQRKIVYKEWARFDSMFIDRLTYIFRKIGKTCGFTIDDWNVSGATPGFYGDINSLCNNKIIYTSKVIFEGIRGTYYSLNSQKIIINGKIIDMRKRIPKRWLFENFEQELKSGRKLFLQKEERKNAAINNLKKIAREKLSSKELKALGL